LKKREIFYPRIAWAGKFFLRELQYETVHEWPESLSEGPETLWALQETGGRLPGKQPEHANLQRLHD